MPETFCSVTLIFAANAEVKCVQSDQQNTSKLKRKSYTKFTDAYKAAIAKQAAELQSSSILQRSILV